MKQNRDILLSGFNLALWAGLYAAGIARHEQLLGLGLVLVAYLLAEWPKNSKVWMKYLFILTAHGLMSFSLLAFRTGGETLWQHLIDGGFAVCYFLQWNCFRKSLFGLFNRRGERIAAGILCALAFSMFFTLFYPDFLGITKGQIIALPETLATHYRFALTAAGAYGTALFFVPVVRVGK